MNQEQAATVVDQLGPLVEKLRFIALEPTLVEPPPTLYHFTDEDAMRSIINSGTMWATCLPSLKDKKETAYPICFCRDYLKGRLVKEAALLNKGFIQAALHHIETSIYFFHCLEKQAAVCLSKRVDLDEQWTDYAEEGRGYALGFSRDGLLNTLLARVRDPNSGTDINWGPRTMVYPESDQREILDKLLDEIFVSSFFRNPGSPDVANGVSTLALYAMAVAAASFKRSKFSSEHEVRLTIANHLELSLTDADLQIKERSAGVRTVKYLEVDLRGADTGVMPLTELVIGPAQDPKSALVTVEDVLNASGYSSALRPRVRQQSWKRG